MYVVHITPHLEMALSSRALLLLLDMFHFLLEATAVSSVSIVPALWEATYFAIAVKASDILEDVCSPGCSLNSSTIPFRFDASSL